MKLFGNSRNGRHSGSAKTGNNKDSNCYENNFVNSDHSVHNSYSADYNSSENALYHSHNGITTQPLVISDNSPTQNKKSHIGKILLIIVLVLIFLALAGLAWIKFGVKPPNVDKYRNDKKSSNNSTIDGNDNSSIDPNGVMPAERSTDKYTFLLLGSDDGNGNTDTIMVATLDITKYTLDIVSIPRDTLVNVSWFLKKANTLYSYSGIDGALDHFSDILGFRPDFYVIVDLDAFATLVDAIGGVDYDIPVDMHYSDPYQDLYIDFNAGMQHLDGDDALKVVRFRSGYALADIARIGTQQDFLKTAATQIIENRNSLKITSLAEIFIKYVDTDLSVGNVVWFAKEFLKLDSENINFYTIPNNMDDRILQGSSWISYVTIYPNEWLKMLNDHINPFDKDIRIEELSILSRDSNGTLYSTDGFYADSSLAQQGSYYNPNDIENNEYENDPDPGYSYDPPEWDEPEPGDEPYIGEDDPYSGDDPGSNEDPYTGDEPDPPESDVEDHPIAPWA